MCCLISRTRAKPVSRLFCISQHFNIPSALLCPAAAAVSGAAHACRGRGKTAGSLRGVVRAAGTGDSMVNACAARPGQPGEHPGAGGPACPAVLSRAASSVMESARGLAPLGRGEDHCNFVLCSSTEQARDVAVAAKSLLGPAGWRVTALCGAPQAAAAQVARACPDGVDVLINNAGVLGSLDLASETCALPPVLSATLKSGCLGLLHLVSRMHV